jgi:acetylornithine deacetylase
VTDTRERLTTLIEQLVRMDSQNPSLAPGGAGEQRIAEYCTAWLQQHGVDAWIDEVAPGRCNAVGRVAGAAAPTLGLCAHLDTVSLAGAEDGLEPRIHEGRVYGRGAYDMKSGVAAIMVALAELAKTPPPATVLAALVADEEYASIGAADFVRRYPVDACIVTEPSEGQLILAHKGFVWVEIETDGVAAHGSRWQDGVSAIGSMGRIIAALDAFDRDELRRRTHPLVGPASLHCATVAGGTGWSTYAERCTLRVERRTLPGESPAEAVAELRAVIGSAGEQATVREVLSRSPLECPADSPVARAVRNAIESVTGSAAAEAGVAYWMDAAIFADAGAATVNYGPSGGGAHGAVEWVEIDSAVRCAHVLHEAAVAFAGGARPLPTS